MSTEGYVSVSTFNDFVDTLADLRTANGKAHAKAFREKVVLRANRGRGFPYQEISHDQASSDGRPTVSLAFLTLAGSDGVLPDWVLDRLASGEEGAAALRSFLDVLNRRFWEISALIHSRNWSHTDARGKPVHRVRSLTVALSRAPETQAVLPPSGDQRGMSARCWMAGRGAGRLSDSDALLEKMLGVPIRVQSGRPVRLPLPVRQTARLSGQLRLNESTLGRQAWVLAGHLVDVTLTESRSVFTWLPINPNAATPHDEGRRGGQDWVRLQAALAVVNGTGLPPTSVRLRAHAQPGTSFLGGHVCRLGWGAAIAIARPFCQSISISSRATQIAHSHS